MGRAKQRLVMMAALFAIATLLFLLVASSAQEVRAPLVCTRGPDGQLYRAVVSMPTSQNEGSEFAVRIDSFPSGKVSHVGLSYLFDMRTDYLMPKAAQYVEGSARVVPNTGTANVRGGARIWHERGRLHLLLPAHVENGSSYTTPSIEFRLRATAPPGVELLLYFSHYHVAAKAPIVGTVHTDCDPDPAPFVIGRTKVVSAASEK